MKAKIGYKGSWGYLPGSVTPRADASKNVLSIEGVVFKAQTIREELLLEKLINFLGKHNIEELESKLE